MKADTKESSSKLHAILRKKIGVAGFKNEADSEKNAGLFEGQNITAKSLREKAWKRGFLCDTDILIEYFNGNLLLINFLENIGIEKFVTARYKASKRKIYLSC